jgi:hypothetical protein
METTLVVYRNSQGKEVTLSQDWEDPDGVSVMFSVLLPVPSPARTYFLILKQDGKTERNRFGDTSEFRKVKDSKLKELKTWAKENGYKEVQVTPNVTLF